MGFVTETQLRAMLAKGIPNPFPLEAKTKLTPAAADFLKERGIPLLRQHAQLDGLVDSSLYIGFHPHLLPLIPIGVSNRHVHLSQLHVEQLFGQGYGLTMERPLIQPRQYAAQEKVVLRGPKGELGNVRVLGPARQLTQVELSRTDCYTIGITAPLRLSGDVVHTPGIEIVGPEGVLMLEQGVIVAHRHIHMSPADAAMFQLQQGQQVAVQTIASARRPLQFLDVIVRIDERFKLEMHIDTDEANAADLATGDQVQVMSMERDKTGGVIR